MLFCLWRRPCASVILALAVIGISSVSGQSELVIHKEGTTLYHWPSCPVVRGGAGLLALSRAQAESRGYKPHSDCNPANSESPDATRKPQPQPVTVYLDGSKYYHRKTCSTLQTDRTPKGVSVEIAGKSHWPCPSCKPPIRTRSRMPAAPVTDRRGG